MIVETPRFLRSLHCFKKNLRMKPLDSVKFLSTEPAKLVIPHKFDENKEETFQSFRVKYQDFLPNPIVKYRNPVLEKLQRRDMIRRRNVINIPEFYVGSIMAVTTSDKHATNKSTRFVGICIWKYSVGLKSRFTLRNVVEHQGVEVTYSLYSPVIHKIEVLKLEKRLDETLFYLRDAPNEYSTFPFDMNPVYREMNAPVPINTLKVKLNPRPWLQRYERMNLKGVELPELSETIMKKAKKHEKPWEKYDLMDNYRKTIPEEEQRDIFNEICDELEILKEKQKVEKKKKAVESFTKLKRTLF